MDRERLEAEARRLDATERARLVVALLDSLEDDDGEVLEEQAWEDAWRAELERRIASLEGQDLDALPSRAEVMARLRR